MKSQAREPRVAHFGSPSRPATTAQPFPTMPGKHTLEDALDILQSHLVSRGASGMAGLARAFKIVDTDGNRNTCPATSSRRPC